MAGVADMEKDIQTATPPPARMKICAWNADEMHLKMHLEKSS
jgi:hypothetical protein